MLGWGRGERARRLHVGLLPDADHVVAHHAEVFGARRRTVIATAAVTMPLTELVGQQEGDHDRQQQVGEGEEGVVDQHQGPVAFPPT